MISLTKVSFSGFSWLDFDSLPNSNGYKLELYAHSEIKIPELMLVFWSLFKDYQNELVIGHFGLEAEWGDFCLDTWNNDFERYDYSIEGKSRPTARYLTLLAENEIEPGYPGFCLCLNWDKFLPVVLDCVLQHKAPYGPLFYSAVDEFVFYFHHTGSIGIYYKSLTEAIWRLLRKAKSENLVVKNENDPELSKWLYGKHGS